MKNKAKALSRLWTFLWVVVLIGGTYLFMKITSSNISIGQGGITIATDKISQGKEKIKSIEKNKKAAKRANEKILVPNNCSVVNEGTLYVSNKYFTVSEFWMCKTEVSVAEYYDIVGENPTSVENTSNTPVNFVSWYDCINYCNLLSIKDELDPVYTVDGKNVTADFSKNGWRLPTKTEWCWAAMGAKSYREFTYSGSNNIDEVAWYLKNSGNHTNACGTKAPNQLGIYDMTGNVAEWCWDYYWDLYNNEDVPTFVDNYTGPTGDKTIKRAICGGFFGNSDKRSGILEYQDLSGPTGKSESYGFRVVRNAIHE